MKKYLKLVAVILIILILILILNKAKYHKKENNFKIVTSFYPIYIMTLNIVDGAENVSIENMADVSVGCLHEYSLVTKDLVKLEDADVFIENGLGIELFIDKVISNYPSINIIDSSKNVKNIIKEHEENGHVWLDIENYITQVQTICDELCTINPENVDTYIKNTDNYIKKLETLKYKYDNFEKKDTKVISFNESFEYILEYLDVEALEVETSHEESIMSAKTLSEIIDIAKEDDIQIIFLDKNDNERDAKIISNETNCKIYNLNSCLYGDYDKDSYIKQMEENLQIITSLLK